MTDPKSSPSAPAANADPKSSPSAPAANADPLLAQINGGGKNAMPPLAPGDKPNKQDASRDDKLTVKPKAAPDPVAAADARHSTAAGGTGYRLTLRGDYYASVPGRKGNDKKTYDGVQVNVPRLEGALSLVKNKLIKAVLSKKFDDFVAVRTMRVVKSEPLSINSPKTRHLAYMDRAGLEAFVKEEKAPIDLDAYPDETCLREAVIDWVQNPGGFVKREADRQAKRKEEAELRKLNPDLA